MGRRSLLALFALVAVLAGGMAPAGAAAATRAMEARAPVSRRPVVDSVTPDAGPVGGAPVTIRGAGFAKVDWVKIGGKKARDIHVVSSRVLTAIAPPHTAGSAAISIRDKAGTSRPSAVRFRYLNRPRITGMSSHSGPVTGGQVVTLDGYSFSHVKAVSFGSLRAAVLAHSTRRRLRAPASWAGTVRVEVTTAGGTTARSAADRFAFRNPAPRTSSALTPSASDVVATGPDVISVTGGQARTAGSAVSQVPWTVTLAPAATVPAVGQGFLLRPGSSVYPSGLAGIVTAVGGTGRQVTITVAAPPASLASVMRSAQVVFSGPLSDTTAGSAQRLVELPSAGHAASGPSGTIDFGSISASPLKCGSSDGVSVDVSGNLSLKLEDVEAHVEVDTGSALSKPFVDVWVSYQPVVAFSVTADGQVECSLPAAWQNAHQKVFLLGDTGATITIAPEATLSVGAGGTVTFQQHSYRMLGFITDPDGSIRQLDGQSADPAQASASGQLQVAASGGVQVQVGELDVVGVGISIDGGIKGTATEPWPPQVCLEVSPFLHGSLFAYLNVWVTEWKLQAFQVELDLTTLTACTGSGWHIAWQARDGNLHAVTCPTAADCFAVGGMSGDGYILRSTDGGKTWTATTVTAHSFFYGVACSDAAHCVVGGAGSKVVVTSNGGKTWSEVGLPYYASPLVTIGSVACLPSGTCYLTAYMKNYSGELVYGSANSGQTWHVDTVVDSEPGAMTCITSSSCLAGGMTPTSEGIVFPAASEATRDGWASSYTGRIPANTLDLTNVSCMSLTLCYASASGVLLATTDFGRTWKAVPDGDVEPWAVSCPTSTACVTGGTAPHWAQYVAETIDGGHSWTKTAISAFPSADDTLTTSLTCPSLGRCMATEDGDGVTAIVVS